MRGKGVGRALYERLLPLLAELGYFQAFAGIALPNAGSVGLHEAVGFEALGVYRNVGFKNASGETWAGGRRASARWTCRQRPCRFLVLRFAPAAKT